jgi:SAM-dependent methyltransferase
MKVGQKLALGVELAAGFAAPANWRTLYFALRARKMQPPQECPICGYKGRFDAGGILVPRMNATCPRCHAMERNRLLKLAVQRGKLDFKGRTILHFAPEPAVLRMIKEAGPAEYLTADLDPAKAMRSINIEKIDLADASFDTVICSHILEHVDHHKALAEIFRVLQPGGLAVFLFPIVDAWDETYEDPQYRHTAEDRTAHFGQDDHIKFFGRDVLDSIRDAGFALELFIAGGADSARYALMRGETVFLATKPA